MVAGGSLPRAALVVLMGAAATVWYACSSDGPSAPPPEPVNPRIPAADLRTAIAAQRRHTDGLLLTPGVIGTAVAPLEGGGAAMVILLERPGIPGLPQVLDGAPLKVQVTGRIMAFSHPPHRQRPAS